jgi:hypothetical protein
MLASLHSERSVSSNTGTLRWTTLATSIGSILENEPRRFPVVAALTFDSLLLSAASQMVGVSCAPVTILGKRSGDYIPTGVQAASG